MEINHSTVDSSYRNYDPARPLATPSTQATSSINEDADSIVVISPEAAKYSQQNKECDMTTISSNPCHIYQNGYYTNGKNDQAGFGDYLQVEAVESSVRTTNSSQDTATFQVSVKNPWPDDNSLSTYQERFMELFQKALDEVLSERGLASDGNKSLTLS